MLARVAGSSYGVESREPSNLSGGCRFGEE